MTQGTKVAFRHRVHGDCLAGRECVTGPSSRRCLHGTKGGSCCLALERASCLPWSLVSPFQASSFCKRPKDSPCHSEGMPGARSVGRMTACGYPPALRGIGGYRLWRYSPYGTISLATS